MFFLINFLSPKIFMSFWGALLSAVLPAVVGGILGNEQTEETNEANKQIAEGQREWEERMSNTAYQRSRDDMTKAGLNPILMARLGGASTPTYQTPTMQNPAQYTQNAAQGVVSNALNVMSTRQQVATMKAQEDLNSANAVKLKQDAYEKYLANLRSYNEMPYELKKAAAKSKTSTEPGEAWKWNIQELWKTITPLGSLSNMFGK